MGMVAGDFVEDAHVPPTQKRAGDQRTTILHKSAPLKARPSGSSLVNLASRGAGALAINPVQPEVTPTRP
jgi:hypothetical protein